MQDMGALVSTPLRRTTGEVPAGTFNYPVQRRGGGNKIALVLAGIAVLAVGFAAVVYVMQRDAAPSTPATTKPVVAAQPIDAAIATAVDADLDPDIVLEPTPGAATPPPRRPTGGRPPRGGTPATKPPTAVTAAKPANAGSGAGSQTEPEDTIENAPNNPQPAASDCDEVSCVLAKYDRPCCEKYRPTGSDIKPRTAGGLPAELDKSMVRAGIEKVKPRVVACGEKSTKKGTVKIAVTVRPDGTVKDAGVVASPTPALGDCVSATMKKAEFGKSVGGGSFTYPFVF
jgi:outer membrane biosynthesis protein TonB